MSVLSIGLLYDPGMTMPDRDSKPATIKTILVLDDDVLVRMPVVQFLRDCGHRVVEAASTDEAMAIFQKTNFPVDVVLSEVVRALSEESERSGRRMVPLRTSDVR
jgi:PleD family two-component response regulator